MLPQTGPIPGIMPRETLPHGVRAKFRTNMAPNAKSSIRVGLTRVRRCRNRVTCMKIQVAFVAAAIALSGCSTTGLGGGQSATPAASGPATPAAPETIISAMDGGLIGGSIGSNLSQGDRRTALQAACRNPDGSWTPLT